MRRDELVVDSNVAVFAAIGRTNLPGSFGYVAPALLWSEATSALHEAQWRGQLSVAEAAAARVAVAALPIDRAEPEGLAEVAWAIADELGLPKTYDAEYLALARIRGCRVVTADARLRRTGDRLGLVVDPVEAFGD